MITLPKAEADQVRRGFCPHCKSGPFIRPWERARKAGLITGSPVLCQVCLREYNVGPCIVEVAHEFCPADRARKIYGVIVPESTGREEFP